MSDHTNTPQSESVDWAEKLKASLEADTDEERNATTTPADDDLAALLRAQIAHNADVADKGGNPGDEPIHQFTIDEFEIEDEDGEVKTGQTPDTTVKEDDEGESIQPEPAFEADEEEVIGTPRLPIMPDAGLNPPDQTPGDVHVTDSDSRLETLRAKNAALLDEWMIEEIDSPDEEEATENRDVYHVLAEPASTVTKDEIMVPSPRPAEVRDADPLIADTDVEEEHFHAPLQTDFPHVEPAPIINEPKKTPRVSRMFGVYHIAEAPATVRTLSYDPAKRVPKNASANAQAEYTDHMSALERQERAVQDASVIRSLGYEQEVTSETERRHMDEAREADHQTARVASGRETKPVKGHHEYNDPAQTASIQQAYRRSLNQQPLLFLLAFAGGILLSLLDILPQYLAEESMLNVFCASALCPILEIALLVLVAVPFIPRLWRGLAGLLDFEPTRYALAALALIVALLHAVVACFAPIGQGTMPLFGSVAMLMLAVTAFSEFMATLGERMAFNVISEAQGAFVLTAEETPASRAYAESITTDSTPSKRQVLTAVRIRRISDYFARSSRYNAYMGRLNYILPAALIVAVALAGLSIILGGHPYYDGVRIFTSTYLSCLPCGYILSMSLPLFMANHRLSDQGGAILGTAAPAETVSKHHTALLFSDGALLTYEDKKEFPLRDDPHAESYAALTAHLIRLLDMPGASAERIPNGWQVQICERGDDYLRVYLIIDRQAEAESNLKENEVHAFAVEVMLGSHEALVRRGIRLPKRALEGNYLGDPAERVLYLAFDRRFRRLIASTICADKAIVAEKRLAGRKDVLVLSTYDPLLRTDHSLPIPTVKPTSIDHVQKPRTGALVSTVRAADLIDTYITACRMKQIYRIAHLLSWLSIAGASVAGVLLMIFDRDAVISNNTVLMSQIIGLILSAILNIVVMGFNPESAHTTIKTANTTSDSQPQLLDEHDTVDEFQATVEASEDTTTITTSEKESST